MIKKLRSRAYNASEKMANKVVKLTTMSVELNFSLPLHPDFDHAKCLAE